MKILIMLKIMLNKLGYLCEVSDAYNKGGEGAIDLAKIVLASCELSNDFKTLVDDSMDIER